MGYISENVSKPNLKLWKKKSIQNCTKTTLNQWHYDQETSIVSLASADNTRPMQRRGHPELLTKPDKIFNQNHHLSHQVNNMQTNYTLTTKNLKRLGCPKKRVNRLGFFFKYIPISAIAISSIQRKKTSCWPLTTALLRTHILKSDTIFT